MAITDIIEESEMIDAGAPSIKYEGDRPLQKENIKTAGPDWYMKRLEHLLFLGYEYDEAGEIAADNEKYFEAIGSDESRNTDQEEIVEEEGIMRAANGGRIGFQWGGPPGGGETSYGSGAATYDKSTGKGFQQSQQTKDDAGVTTPYKKTDTGHVAQTHAEWTASQKKKKEQQDDTQKKKKEQQDDIQKRLADKAIDRRKKMGTKYVTDVLTDLYGDDISDEEKWDLQRFDTNNDGKLSTGEKYAKFRSGLRDQSLQKKVLTEMDTLGGDNKGDIDFFKEREQGGVHLGSGVPEKVWSKMTPKQKQYSSVVQDYDINKIMGLPKSKETGHQKYTHGNLTYYDPIKGKMVERTGAYPLVANPMIPSPLLKWSQPSPVQESALASLHRLGKAKAGMSNQALGIEGMGGDEFKDFKVSNKIWEDHEPGGDDTPGGKFYNQDPCKGPNPPAYCFTGGKNQTDEEVVEEEWEMPLAFRAQGGRVPAAFGGMMGNDGRRAYGLGSIFRKAKKIFKSPLGKAALLGLGGWGLGKAGLLGSGGWKGMLSGIKSKGLGGWLGGLSTGQVAAGIGGISLATALLTPPVDDDGDGYDDKTGFSVEEWRKKGAQGSQDVPLAFRAEGGDAESGLMNLGGMEKDYRQDGGFVPIGGKERADDVPARLSKNEFVFTADAVKNAGGGDIDKGSEVMYNVMKNLEAGGDVSEESQGLDGAREMFQTSQRLEEVL